MQRSLLGTAFALVVFGGIANGDTGRVTAQVGEPIASGARFVFIYSEEKIKSVEYRVGEEAWKAMKPYAAQGELLPFGTTAAVAVEDGQELFVRAVAPGRVLFTDRLVVNEDRSGVEIDVETVSEERAPISHQEMLYGAADLAPAEIAQARVNYMAARNLRGHLGSGVVMTNVGTPCEGWGMGGSSHPATCVGNGAPFADCTARTASGMTHRIRFYRGGTWSPGGGGSSRRGRRR